MALVNNNRSFCRKPEELAIASLTCLIFNLVDTGSVFLANIDHLRSKIKVPGIVWALRPLELARKEASWLVWFAKQCTEPNALKDASSERRLSASVIINVCIFQLSYLSARVFIKEDSPISIKGAFLSLFGGGKDIQRHVRVLNMYGRNLRQILAYLDGVRSPQRQLALKSMPLSMVPRIASASFVGREETLTSVGTHLYNAHGVALGGVKGIGKSELCVQYAKRVREKNPGIWVFWIDGQEMARSFAEIARCLRIPQETGGTSLAIARWLKDRRNGPWLVVLDDISLASGTFKLIDEDNTDPFVAHIERLKSQCKLNDHDNFLITSPDFKTLPDGALKSHRREKRPFIELPSLEIKYAVNLLGTWIGDRKGRNTDDLKQLVTGVGCEPQALREVADYLTSMRLTVAQYLGDLRSINRMKSQLVLEDRQNTPFETRVHDTKVRTPEAAITVAEPGSYQHPAESPTCGHLEDLDDVIAASTFSSPADVMTTASFVARMLLADPSLSKIPKVMGGMIDNKNKLEAMLKNYAVRLKSIATEPLHVAYADFINGHPKRLAFTIMEQVLQAHENNTVADLESLEKSTTSQGWAFTKGTVLHLGSRVSSFVRTDPSPDSTFHPRGSGSISTILEPPSSPSRPAELKAIGNFLRHEPTVRSSVVNSCVDLAISPNVRHVGDFVKLIINIANPTASDKGAVNYDVDWELQTVLKVVYGRDQSIKEVFVISGEAEDAQATTCGEYVAHHWKLALPLLDALDESSWGEHETHRSLGDPLSNQEIYISGTKRSSGLRHSLKITVKGTSELQIHVSATLTWLAASIRYSESKELSSSRSSIILDGADEELCFRIQCLPLQNSSDPVSCWHQIFAYMAVAVGYPIRERHQGRGLEITYELMIALARTDLVTERGHGLVIRGLQFVLVPTKLLEHGEDDHETRQAVQWHILQTSYPEESLFSEEAQLGKTSLKVKTRAEFDQLATRRVFLGWWDKIKINMATEQDYPDLTGTIIKSNAKAAGRPLAISTVGANLGGGKGITGGMNATVAIGERNVAAQLSLPSRIQENLDIIKTRNLVLYDTDTRRAWMLPYVTVLLHLVHLIEKISDPPAAPGVGPPYAAAFSEVETLKACEAAYHAIKPIISVSKEGSEEVARSHAELASPQNVAQAKRLEGHLERLLKWLDEAEKQSRASRNKDMDTRQKKVYGFELKNIALGEFRFKERRLHHTSGGWSILRRDAGVVFCAGIGNAISPVTSTSQPLCDKWREVPSGKDYLVAPLYCLSRSDEAQNCEQSQNANKMQSRKRDDCFTIWSSDQNKEWEVNATQLLPCVNVREESHEKYCQRTARMRTRRHRPGSEKLVQDFEKYMDGAIIFGRQERTLKLNLALKTFGRAVKSKISKSKSKGVTALIDETDTLKPFENRSLVPGGEKSHWELSKLNDIELPNRQSRSEQDAKASSLLPEHVPARSEPELPASHSGPPGSNLPTIPGSPQQPGREEITVPPTYRSHRSSVSSGELPLKSSADTNTQGASSMTSDLRDSQSSVPIDKESHSDAQLESEEHGWEGVSNPKQVGSQYEAALGVIPDRILQHFTEHMSACSRA